MKVEGAVLHQAALDDCHALRICRANSCLRTLGVAIFLLAVSPFSAQATTPTEVYQAVSDVTAEIRLLHEANFTSADRTASSISPENRRPRHVLQLARTVLAKANKLALINGATLEPEPAMPAREITPGDVLAIVRSTAEVIERLKPIFKVDQMAEPAVAVGKKSPSDVYAALYRLSAMIDGLGIPVTVPNDVHQVAETILLEMAAMARRLGVSIPSQKATSAGKKPKDVYDHAFALVGAFGRLIEKRPELTPKGGLTAPYQHTGAITPAHVRYALNDLLAEVASMKVALGDTKEVQTAPLSSGTTPSNVYDRITETLMIIEALTDHA